LDGLSFSADLRYLAVRDYEPDERFVLHIWQLRTADLLDQACKRFSRFSFSADTSFCVAETPKAK
jgi:hypothetical protein